MKSSGAHRIVFIRTDRLGDVLMNLPALRLLRQAYPKSWVTLVADASVAPLFSGHPDVDEVMAIDTAHFKRSWRSRWNVFKKIRRARFQMAVVSNADKWMHALVWAAGIPERVGLGRKWPFFLTKKVPGRIEGSEHEVERNLKLVKLIAEKEWDGICRLPADEPSASAMDKRIKALPGSRILAVHAGTSNPLKRWPAERFARICEWAFSEGWTPVLIGGSEEADVSNAVVREAKKAPVNWTGELQLKELAAFFRHPCVSALVSSDSGPVHVAWMSGTPVVALYAGNVPGSDPARWGPRDGKSRIIHKPMSAIGVDEVIALLDEISRQKTSAP